MPRPDLLALSPDDLAALANRGLVKRAQRDVEAAEFTAQWEETEDGTIRAVWSDSVTCVLPGGKTLKDAKCDCPALDLCRHILRTVLAWQIRQTAADSTSENKPPEPWDPGRITDALIESQTQKNVRDRAGALWRQGVLAELLRSSKPSARFHCPGHTVRFPVPDDLRYAQCSCADPAPCVHAVLAVQAFRLLDSGAPSGIVSEGPLDMRVPEEIVSAARGCVQDLLADGLGSLNVAWRDRARRVAAECAKASLTWPAQILEELAEDFDRYTAHDAAFTPAQTTAKAGELLLRLDAIDSGCAPVPQAFIRGMRSDRDSDLGAGRFIGLGALAKEGRTSSTVTIFLQDCDNGHVVTLNREFTEETEEARKPFHQLARATSVKDAPLGLLAAGQLLTQGGRRTASGRLVIGRSRAAVNPQNFSWEQLKAPVLVEDFAELSARLRLLPPASFRPRRAAGDFHVCPLEAVAHAAFDPSTNCIQAVLQDRAGNASLLRHPWTLRGKTGAEELLSALTSGAKPLFVAGHLRASGAAAGGLLIRPTAMVFAGEGNSRRAVTPWLDAASKAASEVNASRPAAAFQKSNARYRAATELFDEIILTGVGRMRDRGWPGWDRAIRETEESGYHRMGVAIREVQRAEDNTAAATRVLKILTLANDAVG